MADDDVPEGAAEDPADSEAGNDGAVEGGNGADRVDIPPQPEEPAQKNDDGNDPLTPHRAAKVAGIVAAAVLVCAAVVVAAVWAVSAIVDEDDDDPRPERASPAALTGDYYDDGNDDGSEGDDHRRGHKGRRTDDDRWEWHRKERFSDPDSWSGPQCDDAACKVPGFGAHRGPIVVLVVPGIGSGLWGADGGFGFGELGGSLPGLLPEALPFLEREGRFGEQRWPREPWFGGQQWPGFGEQWPGESEFEGFFGGIAPESLGEGFLEDPESLLEGLLEGMNLEVPELNESDNTAYHDEAPRAAENLLST